MLLPGLKVMVMVNGEKTVASQQSGAGDRPQMVWKVWKVRWQLEEFHWTGSHHTLRGTEPCRDRNCP